MEAGSHEQQLRRERAGIIAALGAYIFWGLAPLYFKLIQVVPSIEVIAHRIVWSIPLLAGFLLLRDGKQFWRRVRLPFRTVMALLLSGTLLAVNWLIFVWAVANEQVLSTSLGYFTGPLVSFLLGFLFLKERLTNIQVFGVLIAASGTLYLAWFMGAPPWIALSLAFSFGLYGLMRKKIDVGPMVGLLWETVLLVVPALIYLLWAQENNALAFASGTRRIDILLLLAGAVTIMPLIWFNLAVRALSLSAVGFFQYIAPSISFTLAVFLFGETFTRGHAVAFGCIWFALAMVSLESLARLKRARPQR